MTIDYDSFDVKPLNLFAKLLAFCIEVYFKPKSPCIFINIPFTKSKTKLVVVKSHGQNAAKVDPWPRTTQNLEMSVILSTAYTHHAVLVRGRTKAKNLR